MSHQKNGPGSGLVKNGKGQRLKIYMAKRGKKWIIPSKLYGVSAN